MSFELLNFKDNNLNNVSMGFEAITPLQNVQTSKNYNYISNVDATSEASETRGPTSCLSNVKVINDDFTSKDTFSCDMTVREKINWLEKKIHGLKNIVDGNEIWMLSKDGHAMKVKCLLTTNELPECKGLGMPSTIKFLRQMKKSLISAGVTEDDWVTLASSRLRGNLRAAWEIKCKCSSNMDWTEFTDFVINQAYKKRRIKFDDRRVLKKGNFYIEDLLLKKKKECE